MSNTTPRTEILTLNTTTLRTQRRELLAAYCKAWAQRAGRSRTLTLRDLGRALHKIDATLWALRD